MTEPGSNEADTAFWQRRLAAQANNQAWRLSEAVARTPRESQEMLHAAHAAMHLWSIVGNENNKMHAALLLAHVCALLGSGQDAASYMGAPSAYFMPGACADWEAACALAVQAHVAFSLGDVEAHRRHYLAANAQIDALPEPEDRAVLLATLRVVAAPAGI